MKLVSIAVCLCLLAPDIGAAVRGDHVAYIGGTAPIPKGVEGTVDLSNSKDLRFDYSGGPWRLPYASITSMEFGEKVGRRVGTTVALGATVLGLLALPILLSKKKKHFLTIGFSEGDGTNGAVLFELSKNVFQAMIPTLEARTGKRVEVKADTVDGLEHVAQPTQIPDPLRLIDVAFSSKPDGALIEFGGIAAGRTPAVVKLQPGEYPVTLTLAGFQVWQQTIRVKSGDAAAISAVLVAK